MRILIKIFASAPLPSGLRKGLKQSYNSNGIIRYILLKKLNEHSYLHFKSVVFTSNKLWVKLILQLVIEGTVGFVTLYGDIAVDDISIIIGPCPLQGKPMTHQFRVLCIRGLKRMFLIY